MQGLEGVRVLELGNMVSAAYTAKLMADLGADVIKVEESQGDYARQRGPFPGAMPHPEKSGLYLALNTNKRGATLDLRQTEGKNHLRRMVAQTDILIHNYPPARMAEFGIDYETLRADNPRLVMCSITPFGLTGPYKDYNAYEITMAHGGGWAWLSPGALDQPELPPLKASGHQCDFQAALAARKRTGQGQAIDISLWEAVAALVPEGWMDYAMNKTQPPRMGNRDLWMSPHNCFRCAGEDEWVTIACGTEEEWQALCKAIGQASLATDSRFRTAADRKAHEDELETLLTAWTAQRGKWEVTRTLQAAGIAAFPSMNSKDLAEDAHLNARGFFARLPHPEVGVQTHTGIPWCLTNAPNGVRKAAPVLGADTDTVLREVLEYAEAEISKLKDQQVLY